jgi:hypothetical protein
MYLPGCFDKSLNKEKMTNKKFYELMDETFEKSKAIARSKGEDYTKGSVDVLANFKEGGVALGIPPMKVCWVFMNKHYQAITSYVCTDGKSESEPIEERIKDNINYNVLLLGLIKEERENKVLESKIEERVRDIFDKDPFKQDTLDYTFEVSNNKGPLPNYEKGSTLKDGSAIVGEKGKEITKESSDGSYLNKMFVFEATKENVQHLHNMVQSHKYNFTDVLKFLTQNKL